MRRNEKREIEARLRALGDDVPQVDLAYIKQMHPVVPVTEKKSHRVGISRRLAPVLCAVCCALLVIGTPVGMHAYDKLNTTTLYIETTETAMLSVGANGKVKAVSYDGAEAVAVAQTQSVTGMLSAAPTTDTLKGMEVEEAVDLVIEHMAKNGSIEDGCEVVISTVCRNESRGNAMAERARNAVMTNQKTQTVEASVVVEKNIKERESREHTEKSPAREKYLAEVMVENTEYTEEELKNFSTGYLRYLCAEKGEQDEHHPVSDQAREYYQRYKEKFENEQGGRDDDEDSNHQFGDEGAERPAEGDTKNDYPGNVPQEGQDGEFDHDEQMGKHDTEDEEALSQEKD